MSGDFGGTGRAARVAAVVWAWRNGDPTHDVIPSRAVTVVALARIM
jgi:hypothetical protein